MITLENFNYASALSICVIFKTVQQHKRNRKYKLEIMHCTLIVIKILTGFLKGSGG